MPDHTESRTRKIYDKTLNNLDKHNSSDNKINYCTCTSNRIWKQNHTLNTIKYNDIYTYIRQKAVYITQKRNYII